LSVLSPILPARYTQRAVGRRSNISSTALIPGRPRHESPANKAQLARCVGEGVFHHAVMTPTTHRSLSRAVAALVRTCDGCATRRRLPSTFGRLSKSSGAGQTWLRKRSPAHAHGRKRIRRKKALRLMREPLRNGPRFGTARSAGLKSSYALSHQLRSHYPPTGPVAHGAKSWSLSRSASVAAAALRLRPTCHCGRTALHPKWTRLSVFHNLPVCCNV
jgi:hypothetical protein